MYWLCLNIKINSVTCPGVWLCPKGEVMVKIQTFQESHKTKRRHPKFPIIFNEKLSFQKLIVGGVESIADVLENEKIEIDFIQWMIFNSKWGVVLAKFNQHLRNIFDSFIIDERVSITSKTDLLMCRTEYFPGIISPKINATFELQIETHKSTEKIMSLIPSKTCNEIHPLRQQKVCHSRYSYPYNCSVCSACDTFREYKRPITTSNLYSTCNCYTDRINPSFCSCECTTSCHPFSFVNYDRANISGCDYVDSASCKCCCCLKYHQLFH